ncbi:hypothetical protein F4819DRAFT_483723 [Hypoxylon fuscum]|nr:hypothetical protein F4819DRAFT_483723 [Hypoxylon fuscum]
MLDRSWLAIIFSTLLVNILHGFAHSVPTSTSRDDLQRRSNVISESTTHTSNRSFAHDGTGGDGRYVSIPNYPYPPFTPVGLLAKDADVLDHLREAIEEVRNEGGREISKQEFRHELLLYLKSNFRDVGGASEDLDAALAKAIMTEMLRRELSASATVDDIINLLNRPDGGVKENAENEESILAKAAKIDLVRRVIDDEAAPPKYDRTLALQADLAYQILERSREPLLSKLNDYTCYCGGDECCRCPWADPEKEAQKEREASDPKNLFFVCICNCCPCRIKPPSPPPPDDFRSKLIPPMGLLCGVFKMGFCPW